jgi:DNA-binding response OmpR family regulator
MNFLAKKSISQLNIALSRDDLLRRSRVLIIDDERPELVDDLKKAHFAVDYEPDIDASKIDLIEKQLYDLILLDFGNVGRAFGDDEGLSLLRHIKRVNPAIVVLSYTSKVLGSAQADFYRLSDIVLAKDAGISESLEKIEEGLRKAHSLENVWAGLLAVARIQPGSKEDRQWQDMLVRGINKDSKMKKLKEGVTKVLTSEDAQKVGLVLFSKAVGLAFKAAAG